MFLSSHTALSEPRFTRLLMGVVIGIFMHISTTILFEAGDDHRFNTKKVIAIILGTGLGALSILFH